jgi:zinc transport system substrate-binding protein
VPAARTPRWKEREALKDELDALDERMSALSRLWGSQPLVASHPVYHYLARRYGMNLRSVLWEPENVPDDKAMADLNAHPRRPSRALDDLGRRAREGSVEKLALIGLNSVVFDPCGNVPDSGDFMTQMKANVEALEKAFR